MYTVVIYTSPKQTKQLWVGLFNFLLYTHDPESVIKHGWIKFLALRLLRAQSDKELRRNFQLLFDYLHQWLGPKSHTVRPLCKKCNRHITKFNRCIQNFNRFLICLTADQIALPPVEKFQPWQAAKAHYPHEHDEDA